MDEIKELLTTRQYTSLRQKLAEMNEADVAILSWKTFPKRKC